MGRQRRTVSGGLVHFHLKRGYLPVSKFTAYYWLQQSEKKFALSQTIEADSLDAATTIVEEQLRLPIFSFDSDSHGRVIILSAHVQYAELEIGDVRGDTSVIDLLEVAMGGNR